MPSRDPDVIELRLATTEALMIPSIEVGLDFCTFAPCLESRVH